MRLLDRFLLRELAPPLVYCLAGFLLFWISFDLIASIDEYQRKHLWASDILEIYWTRLPELLNTVLPIGFLLALLYGLSQHSRHHEITAMRSAGLSLWRICVPYFVVGALFSLTLLWMNEKLVPDANDRIHEIEARRTRTREEMSLVQNLNFRNAKENRIWTIGAFNPATAEMTNPQVDWRLPDGSRRTLIARSATRTNNNWLFQNVQILAYPSNELTNSQAWTVIKTNALVVPEINETPGDIRLQIKFSRLNAVESSKRPQLSLHEIKYIETHLELNARDRAILETQRHARIAQPWTCVIVALIAIPFGAASGRRNVFIGVASSIFIAFAFIILQRLCMALGSGGFVPAVAGAWAPNVIFAVTGLWLTNRVK